MALTMQQQFDILLRSLTVGDVDLASRLLTDPDSLMPSETKEVAQRLGVKGKLLEYVTNIATDPVVLVSFLLSRHFPVGGFLKGVVPDRYVGTANEFTGISKYTRPVEDFFRGGLIPRLTALKQLRETQVMKVGEKILAEFEKRPNWSKEMPIVSMLLEGQYHPGATPELQQLALQTRGHIEDLWGFLKQAKKIDGGFEGTLIRPAAAREFESNAAPKYLRDYLPHIPILGDESIVEIDGRQALRRLGGGPLKQAFDLKGMRPEDVWSPAESHRLASNFNRYQMFMNKVGGEVFDPHLFQRQRMDARINDGSDLFITDLNVLMKRYTHAVARTYAVNAPLSDFERALATVRTETGVLTPTNDPIIVQIINEGLKSAGARTIAQPVKGTNIIQEVVHPKSGSPLALTALRDLTRAVMGQADEGEIIWGNLFSSVANRFSSAVGRITRNQETLVDSALNSFRRNRQYRTLNNGIASYFYTSTLGLNPWSAVQNLLQPALTTMPALGIGPTLHGISRVWSKAGQYARQISIERAAMGKSANPVHRLNEAASRAFQKVFPELAEANLKVDPRVFDIDPNSLEAIGGAGRFRTYDDFAKFLLQPFTHAEMSNQAVTFYAAKKAIGDAMARGEYEAPIGVNGAPLAGEQLSKWMDFEASSIVNSTQFRPSPGGRTIWQNGVPAFARQFTSFPIRALSFILNSTIRGAMTRGQLENANVLQRAMGGRNWGTVARMVLYGRILEKGASAALGVDIDKALGLTAPFMIAPPDQPLAPIPLPPIAGIGFGLVSAAANRDIKRLQGMTLPGIGDIPLPRTLVPGGLALSRIARVLNQFRPDIGGFVDDDQRLMYRGTTTDALLAALGVPLEKQRRTRDVVERVQSVRNRARELRRKFMYAAVQNDPAAMKSVQEQWAKSLPDLPPLTVAQRDLVRYKAQARLPMIQRMLKSMGSQGKLLEQDIYEADPDLIAPQQTSWVDGLIGVTQ